MDWNTDAWLQVLTWLQLVCDPGLSVLFIPKLRNWVQKKKKGLNPCSERCIYQGFVLVVILWSREDKQQDGWKNLPSSARQPVVQILACSCMELWRALSFHWSFLSGLLFSLQGHQHNIRKNNQQLAIYDAKFHQKRKLKKFRMKLFLKVSSFNLQNWRRKLV